MTRLPKADFICLVIVGVDLEDGTRHFFNEATGWGCEEGRSYPYFPPRHADWARRYPCPPLPSGHRWERRVVEFDITEKCLVESP